MLGVSSKIVVLGQNFEVVARHMVEWGLDFPPSFKSASIKIPTYRASALGRYLPVRLSQAMGSSDGDVGQIVRRTWSSLLANKGQWAGNTHKPLRG